MSEARACAHPNIAFIKYWGNADESLRLPANPSLSMNIDGFLTETTVRWDRRLTSDELTLNGERAEGDVLARVSNHLSVIRKLGRFNSFAAVDSTNNFPMGAGIASSASAFAALTVAACAAGGLSLTERELTTIARLGSGSASRSIPPGFVEWHAGTSHDESYAESFASQDHWDLVDAIAIISREHKHVTSQRGHGTAWTSDFQRARVAGSQERLERCKRAIYERDFSTFAEVVELDSNLMHAVMMTSKPPLFYWQPPSLAVMEQVRMWRAEGIHVCYTMDAGPNVHCICLQEDSDTVAQRLNNMAGVKVVHKAGVGGGAGLLA